MDGGREKKARDIVEIKINIKSSKCQRQKNETHHESTSEHIRSSI